MTRRHAPEELDEPGELFRWAETQREPRESNTIREAFELFHAKHPDVYVMFEKVALEAIAAGATTLGGKAVWERLRWETDVGSWRVNGERYRLNNNLHPYYSRMFMEKHPAHEGVFRTRRVRS